MSKDELIERYREHGIGTGNKRGTELYLPIRYAYDVLNSCDREECAVIAIERFIHENGSIYPQMDMIADFSGRPFRSWLKFKEEHNRWARDFLQSITSADNLVVTFVVTRKQDWRP